MPSSPPCEIGRSGGSRPRGSLRGRPGVHPDRVVAPGGHPRPLASVALPLSPPRLPDGRVCAGACGRGAGPRVTSRVRSRLTPAGASPNLGSSNARSCSPGALWDRFHTLDIVGKIRLSIRSRLVQTTRRGGVVAGSRGKAAFPFLRSRPLHDLRPPVSAAHPPPPPTALTFPPR